MNAHAHLTESASPVALGTVIAFPSPNPAPIDDYKPGDIVDTELDLADDDFTADEFDDAPAASGPATALADRAALSRAIEIATNVVEKRNTIPILSNVRLLGDGKNLIVTGTDLDIEISVKIAAAADAHFGVTLPAHTLKDLLKKATASDVVGFTVPETETFLQKVSDWRDGRHVTEEVESKRYTGPATVDFERVKYRLEALPETDFPSLQAKDFSHSFTVPGAALVNSFAGVAAAISTEETRYYLNGVYFHHVEPRAIDRYHGDRGALRMVATDGHRLMRQDMAAVEGCDGLEGVIIPRKTVALLQKLLKGKACPENVGVQVSRTKIRFTFDDVTVTSKTIDGTFPDYQRVIPTDNDKPATFNSAALAEGIRAVSLISSERGRAVKLAFSEGNCQLAVNNPDQGSAVADLALDYGSDPLEIGFNVRYMQELIATADSEEITFIMADSGSPTVIKAAGRDGWLGVLMPMRV